MSVYMIAKPGGYSIEKARRLLGYAPRVSLEEGLRLTEAWLPNPTSHESATR